MRYQKFLAFLFVAVALTGTMISIPIIVVLLVAKNITKDIVEFVTFTNISSEQDDK